MGTFLQVLIEALEKLIGAYAKTFFNLSATIVDFGEIRIGLATSRPDKRPFDERIAKLEVAREALAESLAAIDEMKTDAQNAKDEYATSQANLQSILESSQDAEAKLASIRAAMKQDVAAFQELAGVPNIKRERWVAFFAGFLASTISAGFVALIVWGWAKVF